MDSKIKKIGIVIAILSIVVVTSIIAMAATGFTGVIKTTKTPGYSAMFANFIEGGWTNSPYYGEVLNVSFYLPVDSYVYVTGSGTMYNIADVDMAVWVDSVMIPDWAYQFHSNGNSVSFTVSDTFKLKKGYHTAYLEGNSNKGFSFLSRNIVVMANQKGSGNAWHQIN